MCVCVCTRERVHARTHMRVCLCDKEISAVNLHIHYTFITHSLHIHYTFIIHSLHIQDLQRFWSLIDPDGIGSVDQVSCMQGLIGEMKEARKQLVHQVGSY